MKRTFAAMVIWASLEPVVAAETCGIPTPLTIFLNDGHRLVRGGIDSVGRALEIELRRLGIPAVVRQSLEPGETGIHVVILPHDAQDWDMARKTLGAVKRPPDGSWSPVFIFFPAVERILGSSAARGSISPGPPGSLWVKGLSRIIVHEILHVLLPGRPHDAAGLFGRTQTRHGLFARHIELSPRDARGSRLPRPLSPVDTSHPSAVYRLRRRTVSERRNAQLHEDPVHFAVIHERRARESTATPSSWALRLLGIAPRDFEP